MGDVITRFKLETTQFDSKLRDSSKNLQEIARQGQLAGSEFDKFTKNSVEAARSLGQVASGATTTKDKLKDLVGAYNDLARAYNTLTQEQQQSDFAKAMSQSLDELKTRITDAKNELYGLGDAAEQTGSKFGGALQVFAGNMLTKGAEMMSDIVKQSIDLAKSSEGVEMAFNRLNKPGLLDQLKEATHGTVSEFELMKAAVKFDDFKLPVEELGTMLAFAQKKAKDTGQSVDYMVDSIVTGLGRKSLMILDNLGLSAAEVKEKMAETGDMTTAVGAIIREQMKKAGDYVETAADRAARAAADQQNAMRNLGKSLMPIAEGAAFVFSTITTGVTKAIGFIVENKNAILALSSAVAAYTVVVNFNTIAVKAQKAATEAATFAQKALNLAMKANHYGLAAAAIAAATTALIAYSASSEKVSQQEKDRREVAIRQMQREQAERQRLADRAKNEANAITSANADVIAKYKLLQTEWISLKTAQEKNNFLKENASAFDALGASIKTAADAQKFFVEQSDKVIESLKAMARAEAMKDLLKEQYKKNATFDPNNVDKSQYKVSTAEMRQLSPSAIIRNSKYNATTRSYDYEKVSDSYLNSVIQNHILKNPELKASGFDTSDFRWNVNGQKVTFHMNVSGLSKLEEYRKNNYLGKLQEEADTHTKFLEGQLEEAAAEAAKAQSGIGAFKGSGITTNGSKSTPTEIQSNQAQITKLSDEYVSATDERRAAIRDEIVALQQRNEEIKKLQKEAVEGVDVNSLFPDIEQTKTSAGSYGEQLRKSIIAGIAEENQQSDVNAIKNLLDVVIRNGIEGVDIPVDELMERIFGNGEDIAGSYFNNIVKQINEQLKALGKDQIEFDVNTGNITKKSKKDQEENKKTEKTVADGMSSLASGMNNVVNGLNSLGVEIPKGLSNVIGGIQTVCTILTSITTIVSAIEAISAADALIPLAGGGIVPKAALGRFIPGNSYSGDNVFAVNAWVNSGELVLNRAQQGNLAAQLRGVGNNSDVPPYLTGEMIYLGLQAYTRRSGMGEIVTSNR